MTKLTKGIVAGIAGALVVALALTLAVDAGFSLYNPGRFAPAASSCALTVLSGTVEVQAGDTIAWKEATDGMKLETSTRVRTRANGYSVLTFADGTTTKLDPGAEVLVARLEGETSDQAGAVVLQQRSGNTWNRVATAGDKPHRFEVQTASAGVAARGTLFLVGVDQADRTLVQTTEGRVSVVAQGREVYVAAGEEAEVAPGSPPSVPLAMSRARDELVIRIDNAALGTVVDPGGSTTGYLIDGSLLQQITSSSLSSSEGPLRVIRIPRPLAGDYTLTLHGADPGVSRYTVEATGGGKSTLQYAGSCNITADGDWLLRLHVSVLDGLLQGVRLTTYPGGMVLADTGTATPVPTAAARPPNAARPPTPTTAPGKDLVPEEDPYHQWAAVAIIIIFLATVIALVRRRQ